MYSRLCRSLSKLYRPLSTSPTGSENTDHASIAAQVRSHEQNTHEGCIVEDRPIDGDRPVRVVIMGAGISGITACIRFAQRIRNVDLCVYEKNADVGGTWYENRYPGCACGKFHSHRGWLEDQPAENSMSPDIPAHTYQVTFEPNVEWSRFYASGKEIYQYWKRVARKYGCMKYIKLRQRVVEARWNELQGKWQLQVENGDDGSVYSDSCDVLISSQGSLNNWKWPNIPGLHDFKGKLLHTANWDETYDYKVIIVPRQSQRPSDLSSRARGLPSLVMAPVGSRWYPPCSQTLSISIIMLEAVHGWPQHLHVRRSTNEKELAKTTVR